MKKLTILLLLFTLATATSWAQTDSKKYTIRGININEKLNGDTIYLHHDWVMLDTIIIADGGFFVERELEGDAFLAAVSMKYDPYLYTGKRFYIEPGDILLTFDSTAPVIGEKNIQLEGTPLNDNYVRLDNLWEKTMGHNIWMESDEAMEIDEEETEENYEQAVIKYKQKEEAEESYEQAVIEYMENDMSSPLAISLFHQENHMMELEVRLKFIALMPPKEQENPRIVHIKRITENQMKVTPGNKFVDMVYKTPKGKKISLASVVKKNKYTILCFNKIYSDEKLKKIADEFTTFYEEIHPFGLEIYMVNYFYPKYDWQSGMEKHKQPWVNVIDKNIETRDIYALRMRYPHSHRIIIAKDGTIIPFSKIMEVVAELAVE